jgi:hypothetical protein
MYRHVTINKERSELLKFL